MKREQRGRSTRVSLLVGAALLVAFKAVHASGPVPGIHPSEPVRIEDIAPGIRVDRVVIPTSLLAALAAIHRGVPSFSRQTGLACSACHYQFPQLTPFGRLFKANGYTLTGLQTIGQPGDTAGRESLKLSPIPPLAAMVVASGTQTNRAQPGAQNTSVQLPQQLSLFAAGAISSKLGAFTQLTYAPDAGHVGIDNVDVRYATHTAVRDRDLILGVTVNNNPTVQDVWNTVPAWGFPFMSSAVAPSPIASTVIDGFFGQQVLGLGAYALFDNLVFGEVSLYRSAPQGIAQPLDSTATNVNKNVIPYWRAVLQYVGQSTYFMVGTYGLYVQLYPTGVTGLTNHYADAAVDAQVEHKVGDALVIGRATFIHEAQQLDAFALSPTPKAQTPDQTLSTVRASVAYEPNVRFGVTGGYFQTSGTRDTLLFAPAVMFGSRTGRPNTSGFIGELDYNVWQNVRLGLQYVAYSLFNGAPSAYDVPGGRRASDNNTLYISLWTAF
jgi:hypothetical protein